MPSSSRTASAARLALCPRAISSRIRRRVCSSEGEYRRCLPEAAIGRGDSVAQLPGPQGGHRDTELAGDLRDGQAGEAPAGEAWSGVARSEFRGCRRSSGLGLRPRTQGRWEHPSVVIALVTVENPGPAPSHGGGALDRAETVSSGAQSQVTCGRPEDEGAGALQGRVQMSSRDVSSQSHGAEGVPGVEHRGSQGRGRPQRQGGARRGWPSRWDAITTALGRFARTAVVSARTDVLPPRTRQRRRW